MLYSSCEIHVKDYWIVWPDGFLASASSVFVAWAISAAGDHLYLPVLVLGDWPASLFFLLAPVAAAIAMGRRWRFSSQVTALTAFLIAIVTIALSWMAWIGWIIAVCGGGCFE
jgi:hypothetical protein